MIAYHIDRKRNSFHDGQIITLNNDFSHFDHEKFQFFAEKMFPDGLSSHGTYFISDTAYYVKPPFYLTDIKKGHDFSACFYIEYSLELIRRVYFPHLPSRYQSFFAISSLENINDWPELTNKPYDIWEVDIGEDYHMFDSNLLKGGITCLMNDNEFIQQFSPSLCFELSFSYWNKSRGDISRLEIITNLL